MGSDAKRRFDTKDIRAPIGCATGRERRVIICSRAATYSASGRCPLYPRERTFIRYIGAEFLSRGGVAMHSKTGRHPWWCRYSWLQFEHIEADHGSVESRRDTPGRVDCHGQSSDSMGTQRLINARAAPECHLTDRNQRGCRVFGFAGGAI